MKLVMLAGDLVPANEVESDSVDYSDLGVNITDRRRAVFRAPRRRGPRRKRMQKQDRHSKMTREVRNLRSQIIRRLDVIRGVGRNRASSQEKSEARIEVRKLYMDYKRKKAMLQKIPKPKTRRN